jgi:hypothetical protein
MRGGESMEERAQPIATGFAESHVDMNDVEQTLALTKACYDFCVKAQELLATRDFVLPEWVLDGVMPLPFRKDGAPYGPGFFVTEVELLSYWQGAADLMSGLLEVKGFGSGNAGMLSGITTREAWWTWEIYDGPNPNA